MKIGSKLRTALMKTFRRTGSRSPPIATGGDGPPPQGDITAPDLISISEDIGTSPDDMDILDVVEDIYGPARSPLSIYDVAKTDPEFAASMPKYWLAEDPAEAFADYLDSGIPDAVLRLMSRFGVTKHDNICDLGCGAGHLVYSLMRRGYENLSAMDPSADRTGYLKSSASQIDVIRDLDVWRRTVSRFDAIVSNGVIHHWHHIPLVARDARRTMKPGGYWFAIQEAYANTPRELVFQMRNHPTASRFQHYEWFYPASAYVDLVQSIGFSLAGVVPYYYRGNELLQRTSGDVGDSSSESIDREFGATVEMFWQEVDCFRRSKECTRRFTIPQALIFRRVAVV